MKLSPKEKELIATFGDALRRKMLEKKAEGKAGWDSRHWMDECREALAAHIIKGDPLDVALYAAFLWHHGEPTNCPRGQVEAAQRVGGG